MGVAAFVYGVVSYFVFLGSFLYAIGFVGNLVVPKTIDSGPAGPVTEALLVNALLLGLFALQHSVMARRGFKLWWTQFVPSSVERSTYVLSSSLLLLLLFWKWQPIPDAVWSVENPVGVAILEVLFWLGWALVLYSTFAINRFDLFGLRQVWLPLRGIEYVPAPFVQPLLYRLVRDPLLLGAPPLQCGDHRIHPPGNPLGGARSGECPRGGVRAVSNGGGNAGAASETDSGMRTRATTARRSATIGLARTTTPS